MKEYYHASERDYNVGDVVSIDIFENGVNFDHAKRTTDEQAINDALDAARPDGFPSRSKCIYLFDNIFSCTYYAKNDNLNIYKVVTDNAVGPFPFHLVSALQKYDSFREQLVAEYWNSTLDWEFKEYECVKMEIVENVDNVSPNAIVGKIQLVNDCSTLKKWMNNIPKNF